MYIYKTLIQINVETVPLIIITSEYCIVKVNNIAFTFRVIWTSWMVIHCVLLDVYVSFKLGYLLGDTHACLHHINSTG